MPAPEGPASARHPRRPRARRRARTSRSGREGLNARAWGRPPRAGKSLIASRSAAAHRDEHRRERERGVEVGREQLEDRERRGLGDAAEASREHQRRAELPERAAPGERGAGRERRAARAGSRRAANVRASDAPSVRDASSRFGSSVVERGLCLAHVERARDEHERDDDAGGRERARCRVVAAPGREPLRARAPRAGRSRRPPAAGPAAARSA